MYKLILDQKLNWWSVEYDAGVRRQKIKLKFYNLPFRASYNMIGRIPDHIEGLQCVVRSRHRIRTHPKIETSY